MRKLYTTLDNLSCFETCWAVSELKIYTITTFRKTNRTPHPPHHQTRPERTTSMALRALLARCSAKCHRRASPSPSSSSAAASLSSLPGAAPSRSPPASLSRRLYPASPLHAARAQTQTRSLASEAARGGVGGRDDDADGEEEAREWAVEWEDSEDDGYGHARSYMLPF